MPTEVVYAIRSDAGWNSMTAGEQAAYAGYFTTLSAWVAYCQGVNWPSLGQIPVAECFNDWPSGLNDPNIEVTGIPSDSAHYPIIRVAPGHEHGGVLKDATTGNFRGFTIHSTTFNALGIKITQYGHVIGVAIKKTASGAYAGTLQGVTDIRAERVLTIGKYVQSAGEMLACSFLSGVLVDKGYTFYNCIIQGTLQRNSGFNTRTVRNCYVNWYVSHSSFDVKYCASASTPLPNDGTNINGIVLADNFVDPSNADSELKDYHLLSGSILRGAGTNLYNTPTGYIYDVDLDEWPASGAWDIGYDYFTSGGGATLFTTPVELDSAPAFVSLTPATPFATATEVDASADFVGAKRAAFQAAAEADSAPSFEASTASTFATATEMDSSVSLAGWKSGAFSAAGEVDAGSAFKGVKRDAFAAGTERDSAAPFVLLGGATPFATAQELDASITFIGLKRGSFGQAADVDFAPDFDGAKSGAFGEAAERDSADTFAAQKRGVFAAGVERDSSAPFVQVGGPIPFIAAQEVDSGVAFSGAKRDGMPAAAELDAASGLVGQKRAAFVAGVEIDSAPDFVATTWTFATAEEVDSAPAFVAKALTASVLSTRAHRRTYSRRPTVP